MPDRKTEHPILFSGAMVRAILDGRKTQTRRVVRTSLIGGDFAGLDNSSPPQWWTWIGSGEEAEPWDRIPRCPYGQPGDKLWVRETWQKDVPGCPGGLSYRADHQDPRGDGPANPMLWRPSIHMPRWASRLSLIVTETRVERLQAITEEDAGAEGVTDGGCLTCGEPEPCGCANPRPDARDAFIWLWDSINGTRPGCSWADNPWIWVVTFRPEEKDHA